MPHVVPGALDSRILADFRKRAARSRRLSEDVLKEPDAALIDKLRLIDGQYLKRAAVLLFHPDPERFVTGAYVKIGHFRTDADLLYHDEVHGDLFSQVDKTTDLLLTKYLKALISYEGIQRVETYPVPEEALREAVLNAIAHKDYGSGIPIQISVYDDRVMLWNPGQLPPGWTVERLTQKHSSHPFNPDVANAFFRAGMIEAWGRGIERIVEACKTAGVPEPEFRYEQTGLWTVFRFATAGEAKTPVKTPVKTPERILEVLAGSPRLTLAEVAGMIGKSLRAVERASARLVKEGRLRYVGPRKGGRWEVAGGDGE